MKILKNTSLISFSQHNESKKKTPNCLLEEAAEVLTAASRPGEDTVVTS